VQVLAVQYPGRQDRLAEPPLRSLTALADAIHAALLPWADQPPAFLGHSMGAVLAHALARRLERDKDTPAAALLVSGRRAPTAHRPPGTIHLRDDAGLVAELAALGGFSAQVLADAELLRLVLPAVRADYTALETHTHRPGPPLRCPLTVLTGEDDPRVTAAEAAAWQAETTGPFRLHRFPGGHFYLTGQRPAVVRAVAAALGFPA
jgi:surfactin synthase thioesterase subunit